MPEFFHYMPGDLLLLSHTAAYPDYHIGIFYLGVFQGAHVSENSLLRSASYRAGIENDNVGSFGIIGYFVSHLVKKLLYFLGIVFILLAPVGYNTGARIIFSA